MKKPALFYISLLVISSLILGGCGGTPEPTTTQTAPTTTTTPPTTTATTSITTPTASPSTTTQTTTPSPSTTTPILEPTSSLIQGKEYGLKILNIEKNSDIILVGGDAEHQKYIYPTGNNTFIKIKIQIYKNNDLLSSNELVSTNETSNISLLDVNNTIYPLVYTIYEWKWVEDSSTWKINDCIVIFSIPQNSKEFKIQYRDLPLIDLGM